MAVQAPNRETRLPVSIITGFLGSGKTTLLNRLLQHASMANSLVIINEFGEIGIDHLLVSVPSENMMLLNNGCLCCVFRGDLVQTFADVYTKRSRGEVPMFDRIVVETTGLADPVPVIQTIVTDEDIAPHYCLETVVTLVDAVHGEAQLNRNAESVKQVAVADTLLISKTDLASEAQADSLRVKLRQLNPGAEVCAALHGAIDPGKLFFAGSGDSSAKLGELERWLDVEAPQAHEHHDHLQHARDPEGRVDTLEEHKEALQTFSLYYEAPISRPALALWLNMLSSFLGPDLLRVKGVLNVEGEPVVVHVVQTIVHEPLPLKEWPTADRRSRLVFITRSIGKQQLERTLEVFRLADSAIPRGAAIDPEAYTNFARLAKGFLR